MTRNTLLASVIAFLFLIVLVVLYTTSTKDVTDIDETPRATEYTSLTGTVTSLSSEKSQVAVEVEFGTSTKIVTAPVDTTTRIEKVIKQKDSEGKIERQLIEELNIDDLAKGEEVTVVFTSEEGDILSGVSSILWQIDADVDEYVKNKEDTSTYAYLKSNVAFVDASSGSITFNLYTFGSLSTTTQTIDLSEKIPLYKVSESALVPIVHARTAGTLQDLAPGDSFYILVNKKGFSGTVEDPQGIVIIKK